MSLRTRIGLAALSIVLAVALCGCSRVTALWREDGSWERGLSSGQSFTTQSGLRLTVPERATGIVLTRSRNLTDTPGDLPVTETVAIHGPDDDWSVFVLSFDRGGRNPIQQSIVASAPGVTVYEPRSGTMRTVVHTNIPGKAAGRVILTARNGSEPLERGLDGARWVWTSLGIDGIRLP